MPRHPIGIGRHSHVTHLEARLSNSDHQHVQFMIYRRRVLETWPESASKMVVLAAIESSIASLVRTKAGTAEAGGSRHPGTNLPQSSVRLRL
jgi:hypothetical protein